MPEPNAEPPKKKVARSNISYKDLLQAKNLIDGKKYDKAEAILNEILQKSGKSLSQRELYQEAAKLANHLELEKRQRYFRWSFIGILLVTVIVLGFLLYKRVWWPLEISAELCVDRIEFTLNQDWQKYSFISDSLQIYHLDTLALTPYILEKTYPITNESINPRVVVNQPIFIIPLDESWNISFTGENLNLSELNIRSGASVIMENKGEQDGSYILTIDEKNTDGFIHAGKVFNLSCTNCQILEQKYVSASFDVITQRPLIRFSSFKKNISINFNLPHSSESISMDLLENESLLIKEIDLTKPGEGGNRYSSIIRNGAITFLGLDGKQISIKPKDFVQFGNLFDFRIRNISLEKDGITVFLCGNVDNIETGLPNNLYTRLPSLMEYLQKNRSILLFISSLVPILLIILAILYRLTAIHEMLED